MEGNVGLFAPNVTKLQRKKDTGGLIKALRNDDNEIRRSAAQALGGLKDPGAAEALAGALEDADAQVRQRALWALDCIGGPKAAEAFVRVLARNDNYDSAIRVSAAKSLGAMLGPKKTAQVETAAVKGFAQLDPDILEHLLTWGEVRDNYYYIRSAIIVALGEVGGESSAGILVRALGHRPLSFEHRSAATEALARMGGLAAGPLIAALDGTSGIPDARHAAAALLGRIADPRAVGPLAAALGDAEQDVRLAAASALGEMGEAAVEPLIGAVKDTAVDDDVRIVAAEALGRLGHARAVEPLVGLLDVSSTGLRKAALLALGWIGDQRAADPLVAALNDDKQGIRQAAAIALGMMGDPRAVQPLANAIDTGLKGWFSTPAGGKEVTPLLHYIPASALTDDLLRWAVAAAGYQVKDTNWRHIQEYLDLSESTEAVRHLCELDSPVTSNILHLVKQKKDITVSLTSCAYSVDQMVDFSAQREQAAAELERRGNPPYLPEVYIQADRDLG